MKTQHVKKCAVLDKYSSKEISQINDVKKLEKEREI